MAEQYAMILAAGRGQRMKTLTQDTPKPLVKVAGRALIEYQIDQLKRAGITNIVINTAYLGAQIEAYLQDGQQYGVNILYSREDEGLETGGGLFNAQPLLADEPFVVVNSDIVFAQPYDLHRQGFNHQASLAKLVLVANPDFKSAGDFDITPQGLLCEGERYTFSGLSLLTKTFLNQFCPAGAREAFERQVPQKFALAPMLKAAMAKGLVEAVVSDSPWFDVGTPQRRAQAEQVIEQGDLF